MTIRTRIAPTPSGYLHPGNLYSFVLTWLLCKSKNGKLLLRIDDMDGPRVRDTYLQDIFDTLEFVGLGYDEGPRDVADFQQNFRQLNRLNMYDLWLDELVSTGHVYACSCSRKKLAELNASGKKHCACRELQIPLETAEAAWRMKLPDLCTVGWYDENLGKVEIDLAERMGDFIIRKKDGLPAYQLCSPADDLYFNINYIVRGEDLLASTAAQVYLASILKKDRFLVTKFFHHPLLKNANGEKLSKSAGDTSLKAFREQGGTAATLLHQIACMPGIGIKNPVRDLNELLTAFQKKIE